jgi:hypothetical protein
MTSSKTLKVARSTMTRKNSAITLSLTPGDKDSLQGIALNLGQTWGDKPNISALVEAIAQHKYLVSKNADWSIETIMALNQSWKLLLTSGEVAMAREVAKLLLLQADLPSQLLGEIHGFLAEESPPWRQALDRHIAKHSPFELNFPDPVTGVIKKLFCRYGEIIVIDGAAILRCWCEEKSDCSILPHNWEIHINEIDDASISPLKGRWKTLEFILVEIDFQGLAALSYPGKEEDVENDWSLSEPGTRRVVRSVTNIRRFFAEIRSYGGDCKISAPSNMAELFRQEIDRMIQKYK